MENFSIKFGLCLPFLNLKCKADWSRVQNPLIFPHKTMAWLQLVRGEIISLKMSFIWCISKGLKLFKTHNWNCQNDKIMFLQGSRKEQFSWKPVIHIYSNLDIFSEYTSWRFPESKQIPSYFIMCFGHVFTNISISRDTEMGISKIFFKFRF